MEVKVHRGYVTLYGAIEGLDRGKKGYVKPSKNNKPDYRSISHNVRVSETESIRVGLTGFKQDFVYAWDKDKKVTRKVKWDSRKDASKFKNAMLMGITYSKGRDDSGSNENVLETPFDAVKGIVASYSDGDVVSITADTKASSYNGVPQVQYSIARMYKSSKEFDPSVEDFKPRREFGQTFIFSDIEKTEDHDTLYDVNGFVFTHKDGGNSPITLNIDSVKYKKGLAAFKRFTPGTELEVNGSVYVDVTLEDIEDEDDYGSADDHVEQAAKNYNNRMVITKIVGATVKQGEHNLDELEEIRIKKEAEKPSNNNSKKDSGTGKKGVSTPKGSAGQTAKDVAKELDNLDLGGDDEEDTPKTEHENTFLDIDDSDLPF